MKSGCLSLSVSTDDVLCEDGRDALLVQVVSYDLEGELRDVALCLFESGCGGCLALGFGESVDLLLFLLVEGELVVEDIVRSAHVGAEYYLRAVRDEVLDGRESADDTLVVSDDAVLYRDVEVAADENALAAEAFADVFDRFLVVHLFSPH